jgi:hypothetical protein
MEKTLFWIRGARHFYLYKIIFLQFIYMSQDRQLPPRCTLALPMFYEINLSSISVSLNSISDCCWSLSEDANGLVLIYFPLIFYNRLARPLESTGSFVWPIFYICKYFSAILIWFGSTVERFFSLVWVYCWEAHPFFINRIVYLFFF